MKSTMWLAATAGMALAAGAVGLAGNRSLAEGRAILTSELELGPASAVLLEGAR